ncbi:unnamed protein product [Adineta steineri]|uniref:Uncharacterized protein n=1 Tax=Adineta steineri TaxID=433720 RepID=A0A813YPR8_9BILA|nr:unnamed protein product [Adineta steineri]CAF0883902.1 unnamed protein product [Adineta steineri]CAF0887384.1 unnamed protein product [Adineta steineri]
MGNAAQKIIHAHELLQSNALPLRQGYSDYRSHSQPFTTTDAPWNVTQWIDPLDPHPKITTMPILVIVRK